MNIIALDVLVATSYLSGAPFAFPGLPRDMKPAAKVSYALSRALNPQDLQRFILQSPPSPAVLAMWEWAAHSSQVYEQILGAIADLGRDIFPLHDVACIAVESLKGLLTREVGSIAKQRARNRNQHSLSRPTWYHPMKQVSWVLRVLGQVSFNDEEGVESILSGCCSLFGSMVRVAEEWGKILEAEEAIFAAPAGSEERAPSLPLSASYSNGHDDVHGAGFDPASPPIPTHQQYMNTSDRWMATDHDGQAGSVDHMHVNRETAYPPTEVDLLLAEVFKYSYQSKQQAVFQ